MSSFDAKIGNGGSSAAVDGMNSTNSFLALLPCARARRFSRTLIVSILLTACTLFLLLTTSAPNYSGKLLPLSAQSSPSNYDYLHQSSSIDDWSARLARYLGQEFEKTAPSRPGEDVSSGWKRQNSIFQQRWNGSETADLWDTIQLDASKLLRMREAHQDFLQTIRETLPEYIAPTAASPSQRGIVTVGGGKFFPPLLVSLRILRRTGTTLPVEVFIPQQDYEAELCDSVFPSLGATCRVFPDIPPLSLDSFQFKVFAMLFSSFEDVLLLDADDFPVRDVEPLFTSQPFRQTGMIVWPDFWGTAVSPLYYMVSGQQPIPISARPKSETGQLLVSKRRHWLTLLLSAYYNYFPDIYYPLLCQGCIGCGDSETFLPAADALNLPYYYVKTPPLHVGHRMKDGGVQGHVIAQYDAVDDFRETSGVGSSTASSALETVEQRKPLRDRARPLFMHASFPKWDAYVLLDHVSQWSDMTKDTQGNPAAAFQEPRDEAARIRGVERMAWEEARWVVCTHGDKVGHWAQGGKQRPEKMCEKLTAYIRDVLDGETGAKLGLGPGDVLVPAAGGDS